MAVVEDDPIKPGMRSRQNIQNLALVLAAAAFLTLGIAQSQAHAPRNVSIDPATLPDATVGSAYSQTITVSNTSQQLTLQVTQGSLPAGLSLSSANVLSGTPTSAGTSTFTISAIASGGKVGGFRDYTLKVNAAAPTSAPASTSSTTAISPSSLPGATAGSSYSQTLSVSGPSGPYTVRVTQGSLPSGLSLTSAGLLSGTPGSSGTFAFTVSAFTSGGSYAGYRDYTLSVANSAPVTIGPSSLPGATAGSAYSQTLTVSGGSSGPYTVRITQGSLPSGLSLASGGLLSGTPGSSGSYAFTVSAFTSAGSYATYRDYTLAVAAAPASTSSTTPSISPSSLPAATAGTAYSQTISVSGPSGPYTVKLSQGSLPSGLSLTSGGLLSGTPASSGSYSFTVSAFNSSGSYAAYRDYTLGVNSSSPAPVPTGGSGTTYFSDGFDGGLGLWREEGSGGSFGLVSGYSGQAASLTVGSSSSGPNSSSELASLWLMPSDAHASNGNDTWYHEKVMFPSSYQPTSGEWNWFTEWHDDSVTQSYGANSSGIGIYTDYPVTSNYGVNPRIAFRVCGGSTSSPVVKTFQLPSNSLQRGHWYDILVHFVWSPSSTTGLAEFWVDGQQIASVHTPTLYTQPNGTVSYSYFGLYNYRLAAYWTSSINFDNVKIGSTASAVQ